MIKYSLAKKRAGYYHCILNYEERRQALRKKYGLHSAEYRQRVININKRIKLWGRYITKIDKISVRIIALGNAIAIFTGCNVKDSGNNNALLKSYTAMRLARGIFYKYGLEHKIEGKLLREYVGAKGVNQPADYRKWLTSTFADKNSPNKQSWLNFKRQFEQAPICDQNSFVDNRRSPGA